MKKLLCAALAVAALLALLPVNALAGEEGYYTIFDQNGGQLCVIGVEVSVGDEYISADNQLYQVISVDSQNRTAVAQHLGEEPAPTRAAYASLSETLAQVSANQKKLVAIYCTHSGESYEVGDGITESEKRGGIYDVAQALSKALQTRGIETIVDETMHHPHDAGAYRRSQGTAAQLAKQRPAMLIDVHRDGIPNPDEYRSQVNGQETSMVRLLVGRANANSAANREFAKQLKASADEMYPGLIKDIFIGKGNYNQEIMPHAILLEFGTYTLDKELALRATEFMADVIQASVFGETGGSSQGNEATQSPGSAAAPSPAAPSPATPQQQGAREPAAKSGAGSGSGIAWVIGIFIVGLIAAGLIIGGKSGLGGRLARTVSEMTGGAVGRKPKDDDRLS